MKTPIFGAFYVAWSKNLADQRCINLFPSLVDSKSGKEIGALYSTPGLDLLASIGDGPIRGYEVFGNTLYVVSGNAIYTVSLAFVTNLVGTIGSASGPVSIINNGNQIVVFDGINGYLMPGGFPLSSGSIGNGGTQYASGDTINLLQNGGTQSATAQVLVTGVSGGAVTGFSVSITGAFPTTPNSFSQASTSGSGSGFTLTFPVFGPFAPIYIVPLPFSGPVSASYQDGFGVVNEAGTDQWWQSNLFDLSIWDPLNFSSADAAPDDVVAIAELHEQQFLFKQTNTEVWINAGNPGFAFQRLAGVHIEMGCAAAFSVAKAGEALLWLAKNEQGEGTVQMITGYQPQKVSTKAIDGEIQKYAKISDAIGYAYQQNGHLFYVLIFPSANATWVYDVSESEKAGFPLWHSRAAFSAGQFSRHWSNCYVSFGGKCIVGDYRNGNNYAFNMDAQTDNGTPKKWVRSWRALPQPVYVPMTFSSLQIDMQTGIKIPDGTNPLAVLRWSDDGGHRWSNERFLAVGAVGETAKRVKANRLGSTRLNSGLDRIFELSSTDLFPVAIMNADLQ